MVQPVLVEQLSAPAKFLPPVLSFVTLVDGAQIGFMLVLARELEAIQQHSGLQSHRACSVVENYLKILQRFTCMGRNAGARPAQLQANALAAQVAATIIKHTRFWVGRLPVSSATHPTVNVHL